MARTVIDHLDFRERLGRLQQRDKRIAKCYMAGMTQAEIGRAYGISQQRVGQILKKMREIFGKD